MSDSGSSAPPPPPPIFGRSSSTASTPPIQPPVFQRPPLPSPASRKGGLRWLWWSLGGGVLLVAAYAAFTVISAVDHMSQFGSYRSPGAAELTEMVLEDHNSRDKIALIAVDGVIASGGEGGGMVDLVRSQLERAAEDGHVKAVILRIDSPGGEVLASDEIADSLREFQNGPKAKPVIVSMQSLCASGGYYISAPCRWIVAHELTITGSIGVIFHGYNYRGLMDKLGVRPTITKSGKLKDMWSPDKLASEELPEEKVIMQDMVEESFTRFKKVIREGRAWSAQENKAWIDDLESAGKPVDESDAGRKLGEDWESVADGRVMSGTRALEFGFVDEVGDFRVARQRAERLAGVEKSNLITYEPPARFPGFLRLLGQSHVNTVKLDLGGLAGVVSKLPQGRLYFMSPTFLH